LLSLAVNDAMPGNGKKPGGETSLFRVVATAIPPGLLEGIGRQIFRQLPVRDPEETVAEDSIQMCLIKPCKLLIRQSIQSTPKHHGSFSPNNNIIDF
jgi:hypothetical protein